MSTADQIMEDQLKIDKQQQQIQDLTANNLLLREELERQNANPLYFGIILKIQNEPDPKQYQADDEVLVVSNSKLKGCSGKIVGYGEAVTNNMVKVNLGGNIHQFRLDEILLLNKSDGTNAIVLIDGRPWEVQGCAHLNLEIQDVVKVNGASKQIIGKGDDDLIAGPICIVENVVGNDIEIVDKGEKKFLRNYFKFSVETGDRVVCDPGFFTVLKKLSKDHNNRYQIDKNVNISWDSIGGLESAKLECRESIELAFTHPDYFEFYKIAKTRGILLWGPPGNGKTMFARAMATNVAKIHGKDALGTGYIFVKSPELLNMWVGNTETEIRHLFEKARRHYRTNGWPALLVFDEFEAIAPQRGSRQTSSISETVVPMFLGEMDGVDEQQTKENPIVVILTNRPESLDQAIIRSGRVDKHIKIDRPDLETSIEILKIHSREMPLENSDVLMSIVVHDIFSKSRMLYRINNEHNFTFGNVVSGAILESVCKKAREFALRRNLKAGTKNPLNLDDFRSAVETIYGEQRGMSHEFDIADFCAKVGLQVEKIQVERCQGMN